MALVVFLRGVNVGGHRTFRPSILAQELSAYDVLNVGAAGTFVVRKPVSRAKFRAALFRKLPFEAHVVFCEGRDLMRMESGESLWNSAITAGYCPVRQYPVESRRCPGVASSRVSLRREWLVRVIASEGPVRLRRIPPSHENNRLSWPDRQALRRARYDSELEHNRCGPTNVEGSQRVGAGILIVEIECFDRCGHGT